MKLIELISEKHLTLEKKKPKKRRTKDFYSGAWNKAEKFTKYDPPRY